MEDDKPWTNLCAEATGEATTPEAGPAGTEARAEIVFRNELSTTFRLVCARFTLDDVVQYNKCDTTGALADKATIRIFSAPIRPGTHTFQLLLNLQGNGSGRYAYLKAYHFLPRSSHSFAAVEGRILALEAIAYEKGGPTTRLEDRLATRYQDVQCDAAEHRDAASGR